MPVGPPAQKTIGLLTQNSGTAADIVAGIRDYAQSHPHWQVVAATYLPAAQQMVAEWPLDGLIFDGDRPWLRVIEPLTIPRVNMNYFPSELGSPSAAIDDAHVARLAIDHFRERHLQHLAFVGYSDEIFSTTREEVFREQAETHGIRVHAFNRSYHRLANWEGPALTDWLQQLPLPAGLLLCHDALGFRVIDACRQVGLSIPRDVALLGIDNLLVACELIRPTLSSVIYPGRQIGWECAALLDEMMLDRRAVPESIRVPSPGVVTRASTDVFHLSDPVVAQAMQFIREQAHRPLSVDQVLDVITVSRSVLERRFREVLSSTPLQEIQRAHVAVAKELLLQTTLPLASIATQSGFRHASHLSQVFKKHVGQTPSAFRDSGGAEEANGNA